MRGLIYKDVALFFRSLDQKILFFLLAVIVLLLSSAGVYSGFLATVMLAMTIGMQNVMATFLEEKVNWGKYQRALPVRPARAVAGKYLSVLLTLLVSVLGCVVFWASCSAIYGGFDPGILLLSLLCAVVIPLFWTGICLPLAYWFGFRSAQVMGLVSIVPVFLIIKQFEDGPGFEALLRSAGSCAALLCTAAAVFFLLSFFLSVLGYARRQ